MTRHLVAAAALVAVLAAGASHAGEAAQPAPTLEPEPSAGAPAARAPGTESGFFLFQARCTNCHGNPEVEHAPSPEALRAMPPERIYAALGPGGIMAGPGASLSDAERRRVA
ncbi:MAG TPA: cytochrome c, partial [Steroidobacteraceae bacterium]